MSKADTNLAMVTDDAIEQVRYAKEHARWLAALMTAIHRELEPSPALLEARVSRVQDLASLGQYLADDLANYMNTRAEELQRQADAAGGAQ
ncbi:hypothetical protein BV581_14805 [Stutzerimonas stutzeri]|uniref:hypothetical protein n=1 Tax=Stutzerimonas stutzeri TaxID=316 RepID=UPI0005F22098|nr:hypothetical protein [Stutzerimonas stutzeri]MDH2246602.1 hypothetical protein [Pseudomonas sp. GD03856]MDH2265239.1 hypothetical protein [Pseudomonas sp. GD03855]OWG40136.1 hypothetical protein CAQ69_02230 [Stutzerimonas stutzeri]PAO91446.1 hypothetical protein BV581_14805 [Stutzerimonas stutzeri]